MGALASLNGVQNDRNRGTAQRDEHPNFCPVCHCCRVSGLLSRKYRVPEQQVRGELLWLNVVEQAVRTIVCSLWSSRSSFLDHARVRVGFVAVVPFLVLGFALFVGHCGLWYVEIYCACLDTTGCTAYSSHSQSRKSCKLACASTCGFVCTRSTR